MIFFGFLVVVSNFMGLCGAVAKFKVREIRIRANYIITQRLKWDFEHMSYYAK